MTRLRHLVQNCFMRPNITAALALAAALMLAASQPAQPQSYPSQTVKLVVPFVAGGGVDVVARILAPRLAEELGEPVVIENRGGAGGSLGATAVAQSAPDGYTILFGTASTHGTNPAVYAKLPYDPVRDFTPIVLCTLSPSVLVVPPTLPVKSATELIALARAKPGELRSPLTAPAASTISVPSCSTRWQKSRRTTSHIAAPRRH